MKTSPDALLILGANGQLGRSLLHHPRMKEWKTDFKTRTELDITNAAEVNALFNNNTYRYCINCAAYTKVDLAETEEETAYAVNGESVMTLAEAAANQQCAFIQVSTDYVYDNSLRRPLLESDPCEPKSVYAKSKLLGEQNALRFNPLTTVIRTSWLYSPYGHNFVKTMMRLLAERDVLNVVDDQVGCPTYAPDLAEVIIQLLEAANSGNNTSGVYNFCNSGATTWCNFAREIARLVNSDTSVNPIRTEDYPTAAVRPPYSVLDSSKITALLGDAFQIRPWEEALRHCLDILS